MSDYAKSETRIVSKWKIHSKGRLYTGHGILTWEPEEGYKLIGFVDKIEPPLASKRVYGGEHIAKASYLRMVCNTGATILAKTWFSPDIFTDTQNFIQESIPIAWISIPSGWGEAGHKSVVGEGLYSFSGRYSGDKDVEITKKLDGETISQSFGARGFAYEHEGFALSGERNGEEISFSWCFDNAYDKKIAWRFGKALPMALSLLTGRTVPICQHSITYGKREWVVRYVKLLSKPYGYQILKEERRLHLPDGNVLIHDSPLNSEHIAKLALFLTQPQGEAEVFRIFCEKASVERDIASRRFFIASAVEAILKRLCLMKANATPLKRKLSRGFQTENEIEIYCKDRIKYLADAEIALIRESWRALRHSEAHPDWPRENSSEKLEEYEQSIIHEKRMCAFLGHILASYCPGLPCMPIKEIVAVRGGYSMTVEEKATS